MQGRAGVTARVLAALAIVAATVLFVSGCSSSLTPAPSLFPAVLSDPPPRDDTTMSPDQVKQAMDNLISERNRLCSEAIATEGASAAAANCATDNAAPTGAAPDTGGAARP
jgi:hypothetical protein